MPRLNLLAQVVSKVLLLASPVALGQLHVAFEDAAASSTYGAAGFGASEALSKGSGYWCSSGKHGPGQQVTWTGSLGARQTALGLKLDWAYGPGEYKVLVSSDGGNFEEAAPWKAAARPEVSYSETVVFASPKNVKKVVIVMRNALSWGFFGINSVSLLVEPHAVMVVSGSGAPGGELCLATAAGAVTSKPCLASISMGEGDDVFTFNAAGQLVSSTGACVVAEGATVELEDCSEALEANDGRSIWESTAAGQLKAAGGGNSCLEVSGSTVGVVSCGEGDAIVPAGQKFFLSAVPAWDPTQAAAAGDAMAMLKASVKRQQGLLSQLQAAKAKCGGSSNLSEAPRALLEAHAAVSRGDVDWEEVSGTIAASKMALAKMA